MGNPHPPVAPDLPLSYRVVERVEETRDVVTLRTVPLSGSLPDFEPAQFSMIGIAGLGDVPISISSRVDDRSSHAYTLRSEGAVTAGLWSVGVGDVVTVRGPFGRPWDLTPIDTRRAVFIAGGIGLAPLRAAMEFAIERDPSNVTVLVGARDPANLLYADWLADLGARGVDVRLTVDALDVADTDDDAAAGTRAWTGRIGFVTELIPEAVAGGSIEVFICGPDAMMSAARRVLAETDVDLEHVQFTLERNMYCGSGWCGHCQLGPVLVCRDGPVMTGPELGDLLEREEL